MVVQVYGWVIAGSTSIGVSYCWEYSIGVGYCWEYKYRSELLMGVQV